MVYFTCDACGEQLKKPSVEKHYTQKCRECWKLTCIDCLKDFFGDEYKSHNACMSEDQRYSKEGRSGWDPTQGSGHKGEMKQNVWVNNLRAILAEATDLDGDVRSIVNTIMDHENIPRKQAKFGNFVKNIMRNKARPHSIDKTWELFSQALKPTPNEEKKENVEMETDEKKEVELEDLVEKGSKTKSKKEKKKKKEKAKDQPSEEDTSEKENVQKESKKKKNKKKNEETVDEKPINLKRKREEKMDVDQTIESEESPEKRVKFDWDVTITSLLKQKGSEMKLNKLKKKCVAEYMAQHEGTHLTEEKVGAKFDKKLKKRKYRILKDKVKLITEEEEEVMEKPEESKPEVAKAKKTEIEAKPKEEASFNKWECANLGSSSQNEKFRRLMGIKNPAKDGGGKFGGENRNDKKIFRDLEEGFQKARQMHFGGRCFES